MKTEVKPKPCRCRVLTPNSSNNREAKYGCACGQTVHVVKLTKEQRKLLHHDFFRSTKPGGIHELSHKLNKHLARHKADKGYELMGVVEKFIDKHPAIVECGVDDDYHLPQLEFDKDQYERGMQDPERWDGQS